MELSGGGAMTQKNKSYQKKVIIVSACVVFALLLIIALIANLVSLVSKNSRIARLNEEIQNFDSLISANNSEIEYRKTPEYIEDYARRYLEMIKSGEEPLAGK